MTSRIFLLDRFEGDGVWVFLVVDVNVVPPFCGEVVEARLVHGVLESFEVFCDGGV